MNRQCLTVLVCALAATGVSAEKLQHELLVFPSADLVHDYGADESGEDVEESTIAADVLLSVQRGKFRLFGEYLLTNHESDLERFQIGWEPSEDTMLWFGRYHQPSSVWNHEHHHGQFLQTSISRPAVEEWEDKGGIIPQHFVGALLESTWHLSEGRGLRTAFGAGMAPVLTAHGMEPFDLIHGGVHDNKAGFQARIAFVPDQFGETRAGVLLAHSELNWQDAPPPAFAGISHFEQTVVGAFGTYASEPWRLFGAVYYVDAVPQGGDTAHSDDDFLTGYAQLEFDLPHGLDPFLRYEGSLRTQDALYLQLFPDFAKTTLAGGLRWQFAKRHALSVQVSGVSTRSDDYTALGVQWSAALP